MPRSILIVDDETMLAKNIQTFLARHGYDTRTAISGEQALDKLQEYEPDLVLVDYKLGGMDGLELLQRIRTLDTQSKVIFMTAHGNVQIAVEAMKAGAYDYLSKPLALEELKLLLDKASNQERLESALAYYQSKQAARSGLHTILGESAPMSKLKHSLWRFIDAEQHLRNETPPAVLIIGETGTGKELVARALHFEGQRQAKPFFEIDCASFTSQQLEAELFGYERGAISGARERKPGLIEAADNGSLYLSEIGELDLNLQAKLLRLLKDKVVRRLGELRDREVDVRIIAASSRDLDTQARQEQFRSDLLFRLRTIHFELPPLRQRGDDIVLLANQFLTIHGKRYGKPGLHLSLASANLLRRHHWPGNVRELHNTIEQATLLTEGSEIEPAQLAINLSRNRDETPFMHSSPADRPPVEYFQSLEQLERNTITQALHQTKWNITQAAQILGISRDTLRYRISKHGLNKP